MLSVLIIFLFALDFKMLKLFPNQVYSVNRPPITATATEYYEIQFGEPTLYIEITYHEGSIHLVPKDTLNPVLVLNAPIVSWYWYVGALALANIIPFHWFTKKDKPKHNKQK